MAKGRDGRRPPTVIYRSSFSSNPGSQGDLAKILVRWDLAVARKLLQNAREGRAQSVTEDSRSMRTENDR